MQRSIFLARLIGPFYAVCGIALMLNADVFRAIGEEIIESPALVYIAGLLALAAGLALVNTHNVWTADWRVLITLSGWICLIAGIIRVAFPAVTDVLGMMMLARVSNTFIIGEGIVCLAIGAWLTYAGYAPSASLLANAPTKRKKA